MKRFLVDALLVLCIVCLGSLFREEQESAKQETMETRIERFEQQLGLQQEWEGENAEPLFYEVQENKASSFAEGVSTCVVEVVKDVTLSLTEFFTDLTI